MYRREFLKNSALSLPLFSCGNFYNSVENKLFFEIGLAQWSFNRTIKSGELDNLDFVKVAKKKFDINVVEYVNQFFFFFSKDKTYLKEMLKRSDNINMAGKEIISLSVDMGIGTQDGVKEIDGVPFLVVFKM